MREESLWAREVCGPRRARGARRSARHNGSLARRLWLLMSGQSVDDLLDELNGLLDEPVATLPRRGAEPSASVDRRAATDVQQQTGAAQRGSPPPASSALADSDLDALLADVESFGLSETRTALPPRSHAAARPSASPSSATTSASEHATNLRCSKCDLRVLRFAEKRWEADVDYMFLRNHMPNVDKLLPKLRSRDGDCAYSCQCTWVTVELGAPHGVSHWFMTRAA